jgi:hypothetical protein
MTISYDGQKAQKDRESERLVERRDDERMSPGKSVAEPEHASNQQELS